MRRVAGLLLLGLLLISGCSRPSLIGTWSAAASPTVQLVVTVRNDQTFSMVATINGVNHVTIRLDGITETAGDWIKLDTKDGNFIAGDITAATQYSEFLHQITSMDGAGRLRLIDSNNAELKMGSQ